jgi:hypothetical protein
MKNGLRYYSRKKMLNTASTKNSRGLKFYLELTGEISATIGKRRFRFNPMYFVLYSLKIVVIWYLLNTVPGTFLYYILMKSRMIHSDQRFYD